jgi:hypothetical protein
LKSEALAFEKPQRILTLSRFPPSSSLITQADRIGVANTIGASSAVGSASFEKKTKESSHATS